MESSFGTTRGARMSVPVCVCVCVCVRGMSCALSRAGTAVGGGIGSCTRVSGIPDATPLLTAPDGEEGADRRWLHLQEEGGKCRLEYLRRWAETRGYIEVR